MLRSSLTLAHGGRSFTIAEHADQVIKGRLACDCTKSQLIRQYCDATFPALKCGHTIAIASLVDAGPSVGARTFNK
jgi:hypothetical protein